MIGQCRGDRKCGCVGVGVGVGVGGVCVCVCGGGGSRAGIQTRDACNATASYVGILPTRLSPATKKKTVNGIRIVK